MSNITLFVDTNPINRTTCLTNASGSPIPSLTWVFADTFPVTITLLDTGSFVNTNGTLASIAIGIPGQGSVTYDPCGIINANSYSASIHLNTYELSASLGFAKQKDYKFELQIVSGSSITSFQHPCTILNDVVANQLIHITGSVFVISASYSAYAVSSSIADRAISASHADTADKISFGDPNNLVNSSILVRGQGGCLISMGEQNLLNQITVAGLSIYDETIRISPSTTWFSGSNNFGIGVSSPDGDPYNKLQVAGNISCSAVSASKFYVNNNVALDTNGLNVGNGVERVLITPTDFNLFGSGGATAVLSLGDDSYIKGIGSFGIGTNIPQAKLHVQGNISASSVTASLEGTASWSNTASA